VFTSRRMTPLKQYPMKTSAHPPMASLNTGLK
jgi:hypothetical protein